MESIEKYSEPIETETGPTNWPVAIDAESGKRIDMPFREAYKLAVRNPDTYYFIEVKNGIVLKRKKGDGKEDETVYYTADQKEVLELKKLILDK